MPSLFNRRSRSVSTSRPVTPASSSAHVAATQAFLASRQSQGNLSSAAAAAALRSMSPTPTPVNQVQTKRMLNRQASNASVGSAARGRSRPTVQRRPSSGSMTERTFRSPSPGRQASSQVENVPLPPPVPPLPKTFATEDVPPIPQRSHRRSMSLENFSPRMTVVTPVKKPQATQRNVSASSIAAVAAATRSANSRPVNEMERSDSRNSYNFSYPRGSRPNSPPPQTSRIGSNVSGTQPGPAPTDALSAMETRVIQNTVAQTAEKPVKKKKKKQTGDAGEGSHLQNGSMNGQASAAGVSQPPALQDAGGVQAPIKPKKKKTKPVLSGEHSHFPDNVALSEAAIEPKIADDVQQKRAQRAAGALTKQPSVVREDWEGEQDEVVPSIETPVSAKPARNVHSKKAATEANMSRKIEDTSRASVHANVTTPPSNQAKNNLAPNEADAQNGRQTSISPSRSFRFSDRIASDLTSGRKHEPLPRSISPAKSALKHHSPSRSDNSPTDANFSQRRGSSVTPSESSEMSVDVAARKKANRVSFEATPEVVNAATTSDPSLQMNKDSGKRSWFTKSKKPSPLGKNAVDDDAGEGMKPRPVLPSFGSVRKNRQNESSPSPASRKAEAASASTALLFEASSTAQNVSGISASNDHAIGNILSQKSNEADSQSSPPEVTSVEGTGYVSDSESLTSEDEEDVEDGDGESTGPSTLTGSGLHYSETGSSAANLSSDKSVSLPVIAIQPATPGIDAGESNKEWTGSVSGNFPESDAIGAAPVSRESQKSGIEVESAQQTIGLGLEGENQAENLTSTDSPADDHRLNTITEESDDDDNDDNDSLYDDAPEDYSELDAPGFGSINAIVVSPVVKSSPSPPDASSPLDSKTDSGDDVKFNAASVDDVSWEKSQAYWSGVSKQLRTNAQESRDQQVATASIDTPTMSSTLEKVPVRKASLQPAAEIVPKSKKKNSATATSPSVRPSTTTIAPANGKVTDPSSSTTKSISRATAPNTFRHSMREQSDAGLTLRPRPQSMINSPTSSLSQGSSATMRKQSTLAKPAPSKLQRTLSNDSDSDSSFKRARPKKAAGSGFSRKSMRNGGTGGERTIGRGDRDVRSMSPVNRQPLSPSGPSKMRTSMRGSQAPTGPTLRGPPEQKRSSSLFGKSRKAKSPSRPMSVVGLKPRPQSRFVDSDDEDGPTSYSYRSRYADSSDDEGAEALRPVRGIPRRADEGDSTDLEDSSDDQRRKNKPSTPRKKLEVNIPSIASPVVSEPMSPATAKKKGFWGRLRSKKDKAPNAQFTIAERNKESPVITDISTQKSAGTTDADAQNAAQLGFSSAAERDALVEQMMKKLEAAQDSAVASPGTSQKRLAPQRVLSDSWPLPPKLHGIPEDRPVTSAGAGQVTRPGMGERQPTSETVRTAGGTAVYGRNGKKKKFPRLRKAFGLTD